MSRFAFSFFLLVIVFLTAGTFAEAGIGFLPDAVQRTSPLPVPDTAPIATTTATSSPKIATSTPTTTPPTSSTGSKQKSQSQMQSLFQDYLKTLTSKVAQTAGNIANGLATGVTAPTGIPFGGPILTIDFCLEGKIWVMLGPPTPMAFIWAPGTISYMYGPPAIPGQYLLGIAGPPDVCVISKTLSKPGLRIIFHGSSGPSAPSAPSGGEKPAEPKTPSQCGTNPSGYGTGPDKALSEKNTRELLGSYNILINRANACGLNQTFQAYQAANCPKDKKCGCTDVSGLKCEAIDYLKNLREKCDFMITGGSEAGHKTHSGGSAIDISASPSCIAKNFTPMDATGCMYVDKSTGTTFRNEAVCAADGTTGPHFHVCFGGKGC